MTIIRHRRTGEKAIPAATVYTVKNDQGDQRHFTVVDGKVTEVVGYKEGFGTMLLEPDNTNRWADLERWHPGQMAGELAASPINPVLYRR